MSNTLTNMCRSLRMSPVQKSVLMAIADQTFDTGQCFHSIPALAEWTCLSRTSVIDAMRWLEQQGLIVIAKETGKSNRCVLSVERIAQLTPTRHLDPSARRTRPAVVPVHEADPTSTPGGPLPVREADYTRPPGVPNTYNHKNIETSGAQSAVVSLVVQQPKSPKKAKAPKNTAVIPDDMLPDWMRPACGSVLWAVMRLHGDAATLLALDQQP